MNITETPLSGDNLFDSFKKLLNLDNTIHYIIKTGRFDKPLFITYQ